MNDGRTNLAQQVADEVRTHFPETTLRTTVPRSVRISEAPSYGQTVMTYDPGSSGALAYLEAARELAERAEARPVDAAAKKRPADAAAPADAARPPVTVAAQQSAAPVGSVRGDGPSDGNGAPASSWDHWRSAGKEES
jgi:chromosome partitioning protein